VESILSRLLMVADYDVEKAEKGIVLLMRLIKLPENQIIRVLQEMFPEKVYSRVYLNYWKEVLSMFHHREEENIRIRNTFR
jgi:hypothetical protein